MNGEGATEDQPARVAVRQRRIVWISAGLSLAMLAGVVGWSLLPAKRGERQSFAGLVLELEPMPARVESPLGLAFEVSVNARVSAPASNGLGEWRTVFTQEAVDPSWLRLATLNAPTRSGWSGAFTCVAPYSGELRLLASVEWRPPGNSGFPDESTGVKDELVIPVRCAGPASPRCGDGLVTHDEQCDSTNLLEDSLRRLPGNSHRTSTTSCTLLGKGSGPLRCGRDCRYDTSACVVPASCGNGQVDEGELCDGGDFARASCSSEGFSDGQLRCRADCQLDVTACRFMLE